MRNNATSRHAIELPTTTPEVGALIICNLEYTPVLEIRDYAPGTHKLSPIVDAIPAREYVTARGSRWTGIRPDGTPHNAPRAVREV